MTESNPFLSETYESDRNIIKHSINQYSELISKIHGEDKEEVKKNLLTYFKANKDQYKSRRAKIIIKNKVGDREVKVIPFSSVLKHVQDKNYHFSPSMIAYTNSDEEECVNSIGTRLFIANRKYYKNLRQDAKAVNDKDLYGKYHELQNAFKIFNNAQSGAMSSGGNCMTNHTGHTSLTSTTRCLTSTANLTNEQFIAGNRFYHNPDATLQSMIARIQVTDFKLLEEVMEKYKLHYPSPEDLMKRVRYCSSRYWDSESQMKQIETFVDKLNPLERASILYSLDLFSLFNHNREMVTTYFDKWCNVPEFDGTKLLKPDSGDRYVLCVSKLPRDPSNEQVQSLNYYHVQVEKEYADFIKVFFKSPIPPTGLFNVINAVRDCVLTSDTDSSIYSVDEMIDSYTNDNSQGVKLNGVLTYFIRMISLDQHRQLSSNMNVSKKNLTLLEMKNEFYLSAYVTTDMSKHYYAYQDMVEGVVNSDLEIECKGVHLKSSKIASVIKDKAQELMVMTLDAIKSGGTINAAEVLHGIGELERSIVNDIQNGDYGWLSRESIKPAAAYTNPDSEKYLYHSLWEDVFSEKYGPAPELPYTGIKMSVDLTSKSKLNAYLERIEDITIREKFKAFLESKGKDKLTNLYLPMERAQNLKDIPLEFKQAIDYRTLLKQNLKSVYTVLHSTGIYYVNDSITRLVSDEH